MKLLSNQTRAGRSAWTGTLMLGAALALALLAAAPVLHHRRGAFLERFDPHREIADDVLVDAHGALELAHRHGRRIEIEEHVVSFAVLLHAIGEVAQTPILPLGHLAALRGDGAGVPDELARHLRRYVSG